MQMFFMKNMTAVSVAALIFSIISLGIVAEQPLALRAKDSHPSVLASGRENASDVLLAKARIRVNHKEDQGADIRELTLPSDDEILGSPLENEELDASPTPSLEAVSASEPMTLNGRAMRLQPVSGPRASQKQGQGAYPGDEKDSTDPTAEGDRKGGRHKGPGIYKGNDLRLIPIIRMGEDYQEANGVRVVNPLNN